MRTEAITQDEMSLVRRVVRRVRNGTRAAALVGVAVALAAVSNALNPLGIRWTAAPDGRVGIPRAFESRLPEIDVTKAFTLYRSGDALFVDSRDQKDYDEDHIPGAINIPMRRWDEVWPAMQFRLPKTRLLVLYCYGVRCGLSTRQGKRLLELGYEHLAVLDYGWKAWREAGYPTLKHPEEGL